MKKIVFMLAAVAMAAAANAAYVDWKFGKDTSYNGYTVYAFGGSSQSTVLSALAAYDSTAQSTIDGLVLDSKSVTKGNASVSGTNVGDESSLFLVAVNGAFSDGVAFKYDTLDITGLTYDGGQLAPGTATLSAFGNNGTVVAKSSGGGEEPSGVPEPTSGLLMLVGLGALALRRRR